MIVEVTDMRGDGKFVARVQGHHEIGEGASAAEALRALADRLDPHRTGYLRTERMAPTARAEMFVDPATRRAP